jgi:hypothetical protein
MENISKIKVRTIFPPEIQSQPKQSKVLLHDIVSWWQKFNTGNFNVNHYLKIIQERKTR